MEGNYLMRPRIRRSITQLALIWIFVLYFGVLRNNVLDIKQITINIIPLMSIVFLFDYSNLSREMQRFIKTEKDKDIYLKYNTSINVKIILIYALGTVVLLLGIGQICVANGINIVDFSGKTISINIYTQFIYKYYALFIFSLVIFSVSAKDFNSMVGGLGSLLFIAFLMAVIVGTYNVIGKLGFNGYVPISLAFLVLSAIMEGIYIKLVRNCRIKPIM